ncbi:MAG: asparagine synthase-related protein [Candidatus Saccharibacteria bacterium]|nr:asparagine synthase-related protein [Candidatus Saccharibacteria bacterium]
MKVDKNYCMNSFLQFRYVYDDYVFKDGLVPNYYHLNKKYTINNSSDLDKALKEYIDNNFDEKTALMLSGGIDSAILASYIPKGSKAFTLKCIADEPTIDETISAKKVAEHNGLDHEIIEITWEDYEKYCDTLLNHKKAPFHSIEVQIYKAALRAKELGYTKLLFGESADSVFGGLDGLLSKDWSFEEFIDRFNYVDAKKVLNHPKTIITPYEKYKTPSGIDTHTYINQQFFQESFNSYMNACSAGEIEFLAPFTYMTMGSPLDLDRIRKGDSKYLVRELYKQKYPNFKMNPKTPMPRPMDLWLRNWGGPKRSEFKEDCINDLVKDEKWLVYILEKFLNHFNIEED